MVNQEKSASKARVRGKDGKRLAALTAAISLLVICVVFPSVIYLVSYQKLKLIDQYIHEVPNVVEAREREMEARSRVFEEDALSRAALGLKVYQDESELTDAQRLEKTRAAVAADSVSLTDGAGIRLSTGCAMPETTLKARIASLENGVPALEVYTPISDDQEAVSQDGRILVALPLGENGSGLVFEFACEPLMAVHRDLRDWTSILGHTFSGLDAMAFVRTGDGELIGYPLDGFTGQERSTLLKRVTDIFDKGGQLFKIGGDCACTLVSVMGHTALAVRLPYPEQDAALLLLTPLWNLVKSGVCCAAAISLFVILNLILYPVYVVRLVGRRRAKKEREAFRRRLSFATRPGRLTLIAVVGCFTLMLLMLESRATIAYIGTTRLMALQEEVNRHESQKGSIQDVYTDSCRTRAQLLSDLLSEKEDYRTRDNLQAFCGALKADYLMLFDKNGHEKLSSNSYTGFSAAGNDANLSEAYRAVLLGYPSVVVGPEKDPYTGKQQIGAAALITRDDGQADGFLLAVFDASALQSALKKESLQNTVNTFALADGYKAAVVNRENGLYLAHTDEKKIGLGAESDLAAEVYESDYAGFTEYEGQEMYVCGVSLDGKSLLFMIPKRTDSFERVGFAAIIAALLAIISFLYCPKAGALSVSAMDEAGEDANREDSSTRRWDPLTVFVIGDVAFFTILAAVSLPAANTLEWTPFSFVFSGLWSRGVHLFSLWAALFFVSVALSAAILLRMALEASERRSDSRSRTLFKLADSFVIYATGIVLVTGVLYLFGVNTAALLASAGIVSIAVGMGAKDMVADILAGLFLAVEGSIHMGDMVTIGSWKGRVTDMGIRTTKITDDSQNVKILNNSRINDVVNMSRQKTYCVTELVLSRSVSMAQTEKMVEDALKAASEEIPELHASLRLEGIHHISRENCTARLSFSCEETARESVTKRLLAFVEQRVQQDMKKASDEEAKKTK